MYLSLLLQGITLDHNQFGAAPSLSEYQTYMYTPRNFTDYIHMFSCVNIYHKTLSDHCSHPCICFN